MMEEQAEYITEAMSLLKGEPALEIERARIVVERVDGEFREVERPAFVKISTAFKGELPKVSGDALKVWIFISLSINRRTGKANPGLRTIADGTGLSVNTVRKYVEELESLSLLAVNRETAKFNIYEAPEYVSANHSDPTVSKFDTPATTVSNSPETVSNSPETVLSVEGNLHLTRGTREPDRLDGFLENERRIAGMPSWEGREVFQPEHYPLVDWYHQITGQVCQKSKRKDWMKAVGEWRNNGLSAADLQAAYDMDIKWRGVFTSPNQLTEKAIALKAQRDNAPETAGPKRHKL